jgi:pyridoxamine 5'-phosphate oxidase
MDFTKPPADPVEACERWFRDAREQTDLPNPNAMTVATVGADGRPSARTVLLKGFDARGAVFYTNSESRKGMELEATANASLLFHWDSLERQIRIEGAVTPVDAAEADAYFASRSRESQVGAWASAQSRPYAARAEFDRAYAEAEARFADQDVPRPPHWLGYRVALDRIEFWQGRDARLHDRLLYTATSDGWTTTLLFP